MPTCARSAALREAQQLGGLDLKRFCKPTDDLQAGVERALLKLAQIAPAHLCLVGKVVLRHALGIPQAAQVVANTSRRSMREAKPPVQNTHPDILNKMVDAGILH